MSTATAAKKIWAESKPLIGSKGEDYFAARGVKPPSPPGCLRFAVRLQHPNQQYFPALVIQATNARTGAPTGGIQRVFLAWSGKGKAQIAKNEQKMSLGPMKGGVARLAEPTDGKPLIVGEGVETVLTPITATDLPGWATFGTSGLKGFNPPDDVKWVVLLAGNDGGPNEKALETLIPALKARGIWVAVAKPPPGLKDFNDLVNGTSGHTPEAGLALVKATMKSAQTAASTPSGAPDALGASGATADDGGKFSLPAGGSVECAGRSACSLIAASSIGSTTSSTLSLHSLSFCRASSLTVVCGKPGTCRSSSLPSLRLASRMRS